MANHATLQSQAKESLRAIASDGRYFHRDHMTIWQKMIDAVPAKLPQYRREHLFGYAEALMDSFNAEVEFRYMLADGRWINSRDLEYGNECTERQTCEHSGHYVALNDPPHGMFWKGTDYPYSGDCVVQRNMLKTLKGE